MGNTILQIVTSHKHFGVVLSSNTKWTNHIDTIIQSASKQVSFVRKLKYEFSKKFLNKIIVHICDAFCDFGTCCGTTSSSENVILIDVTN